MFQCMTEYNSDLFVLSITEISTVMPFLLLMCHFGEKVTIAFEKVDETAWNTQWYLAPLELQRQFVMIHAMAQRPVHFRSVMSHTCSYESFKSVGFIAFQTEAGVMPLFYLQIVNAGYSFFMILCRLDQVMLPSPNKYFSVFLPQIRTWKIKKVIRFYFSYKLSKINGKYAVTSYAEYRGHLSNIGIFSNKGSKFERSSGSEKKTPLRI